VGLDHLVVFFEDLHSEEFIIGIRVFLVMDGFPGLPFHIDVLIGSLDSLKSGLWGNREEVSGTGN